MASHQFVSRKGKQTSVRSVSRAPSPQGCRQPTWPTARAMAQRASITLAGPDYLETILPGVPGTRHPQRFPARSSKPHLVLSGFVT